MLKVLRRLSDRRRYLKSRYGWLFQPYTGDELVAVSARQHIEQCALEVAVWRLRGSELEADQAPLYLYLPWLVAREADRASPCDDRQRVLDACLEQLLNALGNRPLLGWRLERICQQINAQLRGRLGFNLPNAGIDIATLYQRRQRIPVTATFNEAAAWMAIEVDSGVVGEVRATAELYRQLRPRPDGRLG